MEPTYLVHQALKPFLEALGFSYWVKSSSRFQYHWGDGEYRVVLHDNRADGFAQVGFYTDYGITRGDVSFFCAETGHELGPWMRRHNFVPLIVEHRQKMLRLLIE